MVLENNITLEDIVDVLSNIKLSDEETLKLLITMRDRDYYPAGAYSDPNAPYNQVEMPEMEFPCNVSCTLERESTLVTDEVYPEYDEAGYGIWELCSDADLEKAYKWGRKDIPDLLAELVKYIDKELETTTDRSRKQELNEMKESAEGWHIVEQYVEAL